MLNEIIQEQKINKYILYSLSLSQKYSRRELPEAVERKGKEK